MILEKNNRPPRRRRGTIAVLLCAGLCFTGLVHVPISHLTYDSLDPVTVENQFVTSVRPEDVEAAVATIYRKQEKRALVGSIKTKIAAHFSIPPTEASEFANWIVHSADKHGVDEILLTSIVATESSFRKDAVSHKGAIGPAQIMPRYWEDFCSPLDISVPRENIECGARILSHLLDKCWDESCAIQSYNMGFPRVKAGKKFPSVERYERTVEQFKDMFALNF